MASHSAHLVRIRVRGTGRGTGRGRGRGRGKGKGRGRGKGGGRGRGRGRGRGSGRGRVPHSAHHGACTKRSTGMGARSTRVSKVAATVTTTAPPLTRGGVADRSVERSRPSSTAAAHVATAAPSSTGPSYT